MSGGVQYYTLVRPDMPMPRNGVSLSREIADRMQVRVEIGRRLRQHYDADARPMPDCLVDLLRKIEQPASNGQAKSEESH
jgi:hypothetical protein